MSRSAFAATSLAILAASALAASLAAQQPAHPAATKQAFAIGPNQQRDLAVQRELDAPADVRVERVPLAQFLETLSKPHKIRFQFDDAGLQRANVKPSVPITAHMNQIPLGVGLHRILGQWKLTYRIVEGEVLITNREEPGPPAPVVRKKVRQVRRPLIHEGEGRPDLDTLLSQLDVELLFVKKVCSPKKEQMEAIEKDLKKCLEDAANGSASNSCDLLPDQLAVSVTGHLSKENAAKYRSEVEQRRAHEREACVYTFVTMLDLELNFSDQQRQSLVTALTARWKPAWSQMIELAVRGGEIQFPFVPDDVILRFLDSEQIKVWKGLPKNPNANQTFNALRIGAVGTPEPQAEKE